MKRLAERNFPERLVLAAIILSCGLVMQAEPGAPVKAKAGAGRVAESRGALTWSARAGLDKAIPAPKQHPAR